MRPLPSLLFIWISFVYRASSCDAKTNVVLLELMSIKSNTSFYRESSIMLDKGEDYLRTMYGSILNVTSVRLLVDDSTTCGTLEQEAAFLASRYYYRDMQSVPVIGIFEAAGCPTSSKSLGDLAREWNAPLFISSPEDAGFLDKQRFPTVTAFSPITLDHLRLFMSTLIENLGDDQSVAIIQDDMSRNTTVSMQRGFLALVRARFALSRLNQYRIVRAIIINANSDSLRVRSVLEGIRPHARVVFIIAEAELVRSIMLTASDMRMTNGEYVFFTPDLYPNTKTFGNISWDTGNSDGRDMEARAAYRSLFTVSVSEEVTAEYRSFTDDVKRISMETYNYSYAPNEAIDPFSLANYVKIVIFGQVLSEQIANGGSPYDGVALSESMSNRTFTVLGQNITFDAHGNRVSRLFLNQLDPETGNFEPVVKYTSGDTGVKCVRDNMKIVDCLANMKVNQVTTKIPTEQSQW